MKFLRATVIAIALGLEPAAADGLRQQYPIPLPSAMGGTGNNGGAWTTYTPSLVCGNFPSTLTAASATGRYRQIGKTTFVEIDITITTNGACGTYLGATLPFAAVAATVLPAANRSNGFVATGNVGATGSTAAIFLYNGAYPGGDANVVTLNGVYEAQ